MSKTSKENKKVLKSFEDLKEGMKVYIRDDLKSVVRCGGNLWFSNMVKGVVEFDDFEPEDGVSSKTGRKYKDKYRYTNEMIDWDKTNELNAPQPKQSNFVNLPKIKTVNSVADDHSICGTFIQIGEETISYVEGNSIGTAYCHPEDEFNLEICKALAYYRWTKGE